LLVELFESYDYARTSERQKYTKLRVAELISNLLEFERSRYCAHGTEIKVSHW